MSSYSWTQKLQLYSFSVSSPTRSIRTFVSRCPLSSTLSLVFLLFPFSKGYYPPLPLPLEHHAPVVISPLAYRTSCIQVCRMCGVAVAAYSLSSPRGVARLLSHGLVVVAGIATCGVSGIGDGDGCG